MKDQRIATKQVTIARPRPVGTPSSERDVTPHSAVAASRSARRKLPPRIFRIACADRSPRSSRRWTSRGSSRQVGMSRGVMIAPSQSLPSAAWSSPTVSHHVGDVLGDQPRASAAPVAAAEVAAVEDHSRPPRRVSATALSCASSRLRQLRCTPLTPVCVTSSGWLRSCTSSASTEAARADVREVDEHAQLVRAARRTRGRARSGPRRGHRAANCCRRGRDCDRCTSVTATHRAVPQQRPARSSPSSALPPWIASITACRPARARRAIAGDVAHHRDLLAGRLADAAQRRQVASERCGAARRGAAADWW